MTIDTDQSWKCEHCSAHFLTSELLIKHWAEYQALASTLQDCMEHAKLALQDNESQLPEFEIKRDTRCPYEGCTHQEPFAKGQYLRRHFLYNHMTCDKPEVCVYCYEVFRSPSAYIAHQRRIHSSEVGETKSTYTKKTVQELRQRSDAQLKKALDGASREGHRRAPSPRDVSDSNHLGSREASFADGRRPFKKRKHAADTQPQPDQFTSEEGLRFIQDGDELRGQPETPKPTGCRDEETPPRRQWPDPGQQQSNADTSMESGQCVEQELAFPSCAEAPRHPPYLRTVLASETP
ncbi:Uncharacterized protein TPAR_06904 [Tolypocladium paradoxum]|uniref:C2H2-type domain-containing protein n=1 Tax=Tolypocladium paradoxum TaxID=94208 RepID=A0A2S4KRV0_9HYPO|nr:Uncharacterized protein TPAR_06904 [Tolypocladium paradoxum]